MTLSTRINKTSKSGLMLFALIPFFFACDDPNALGIELDDDNAKTTTEAVEFSLPSQNIYADSLSNGNRGFLTFGSIQDNEVYGDVKAVGYSEYQTGSGVLPNDSLEFIKAFIVLKSNLPYITEGSSPTQSVTIYETSDTLFSSVVYLSKIHVDYETSTLLGSLAEPLTDQDSIFTIDLIDSFGSNLYVLLDSAIDNSLYSDSLDSGLKPALVFEPSDNNQSLFTLDMLADTTGIYLEMLDPDTGDSHYYKFDFVADHYSEIIRDRSGSLYSSLVNNYDSVDISDVAHLNMTAGLHPRLDISELVEFLGDNQDIIINRAEIFLETDNSNSETIPEIQNIRYFIPAGNGRINGPAFANNVNISSYAVLNNVSYFSTGNGFSSIFSSPYDSIESRYYGDISIFAQDMLSKTLFNTSVSESTEIEEEDKNYIKIPSKLILNGTSNTNVGQSTFLKSDMRLKIYFTRLK